jgi:YVTN family beta-propeller protein
VGAGINAPSYGMRALALMIRLGSFYLLEVVVGSGAMGDVWRATDCRSGAVVAAKVLRASIASDPEVVARFVQEYSILAGLRHPNLVAVRDLVTEDNRLGIIMDFVEGTDLRSHLRSHSTLLPAEAVRIVAQVCRALTVTHAAGIVHRDVKPANILMDNAGVPYLTDFGIARLAHGPPLTKRSGLIGTPDYLAPELAESSSVTTAADIYALGVVLYELIAGRTPFAGGHPVAVLRRHIEQPPTPIPGCPAPLWDVVASTLAKEPSKRPAAISLAPRLEALTLQLDGLAAIPLLTDADENSIKAETIMGGKPAQGQDDQRAAPSSVEPLVSPSYRRPVRHIAVGCAVAVLLIGLVVAASMGIFGEGQTRDVGGRGSTPSIPRSLSTIVITIPPVSTTVDVDTPRVPIDVGGAPQSIVITPNGLIAYVANYYDNTLTPIDLANGKPGKPIPVNTTTVSMAITPDGTTVYVGAVAVQPVTVATGQLGARINVPQYPYGFAMAPSGSTVYVTDNLSATVTPIDVATGVPGRPIRVGDYPVAMAITPNGTRGYVANIRDDDVTPINLVTGVPGTPIHVGRGPDSIAVAPDGRTVYVANSESNNITPINVMTGTTGKPIDAGDTPEAIAITPNGARAYVANRFDNTVTAITLSTGVASSPIPVGFLPDAIAITPDGATAYVVNQDDNDVTPISLSGG